MGIDVDYLAGKEAIDDLDKLFKDQNHGERCDMADEIIEFVDKMKSKYKKDE